MNRDLTFPDLCAGVKWTSRWKEFAYELQAAKEAKVWQNRKLIEVDTLICVDRTTTYTQWKVSKLITNNSHACILPLEVDQVLKDESFW